MESLQQISSNQVFLKVSSRVVDCLPLMNCSLDSQKVDDHRERVDDSKLTI